MVWVVGRIIKDVEDLFWNWEVIGVFDSVDKAEAECLDDLYFIGPMQMNVALHTTLEWKDAYYPKEKSNE